jgi:hypothetical protein
LDWANPTIGIVDFGDVSRYALITQTNPSTGD